MLLDLFPSIHGDDFTWRLTFCVWPGGLVGLLVECNGTEEPTLSFAFCRARNLRASYLFFDLIPFKTWLRFHSGPTLIALSLRCRCGTSISVGKVLVTLLFHQWSVVSDDAAAMKSSLVSSHLLEACGRPHQRCVVRHD